MANNLQGDPVSRTDQDTYWSKEKHRTPFHKYIAYFLITAMIYGLVIGFFQHCCRSISLLSIYYGAEEFVMQALFGLYMWMWNHRPETMRFSAEQTICFYILMLVIIALLYDASLRRYEDESLVENLASVIFGALLAHVPIEFILMQNNTENLILEWLNIVFLNVFVVFRAMFYCLLRLRKLPVLNIRVNSLMLIAGFITALLFLVLYASFGVTGFYFLFPSVEPSKASMLLTQVFIMFFSFMVTLFLIWLFKVGRRIKNIEEIQINEKDSEEKEVVIK